MAGHGELAVEVFEAGDGDPVEIAAEVARRYGDDDFDFARDWPVRIGLVLRHGRPSHLATVYCHLVLDAPARALLTRDLTERENGTTGRPRERGWRRPSWPGGSAATRPEPRATRRRGTGIGCCGGTRLAFCRPR